MICGIIGLPGAGKTLEAVRRALIAHKNGQHVYSNIPLNLPDDAWTLVVPETLGLVRGGFVLLDEVHLWLPARRSMQLPSSWLGMFSQTRKMGWELWWTAQHETRVDRALRDVTSWMYLAEAFVLPFEVYTYKQYEPENFRRPGHAMGRAKWRRRSKSASEAYNTMGTVKGATHTLDRDDPYATTRVARIPTVTREEF